MLAAQKRIQELEGEIVTLKANTKRFDDLDSVKKAFIIGYGSENYDTIGWDENVIGGYVELTRGSSVYRPEEYTTLVIQTKSPMTICVECCEAYDERGDDCDNYYIYDGDMNKINKPIGNEFEKYLIAVLLCTKPYAINWFENRKDNYPRDFKRKKYVVSWDRQYMSEEDEIDIAPLV
jgi:hypothetical protein